MKRSLPKLGIALVAIALYCNGHLINVKSAYMVNRLGDN